MSNPYEPPRARDDTIESELESLHQQAEERHLTTTDLPPRPAQLFADT